MATGHGNGPGNLPLLPDADPQCLDCTDVAFRWQQKHRTRTHPNAPHLTRPPHAETRPVCGSRGGEEEGEADTETEWF